MSQPYEIHVTVAGGDLEKFKEACAAANAKPILIELHSKGGVLSDLQTSSKINGTWVEVREEADRISAVLEEHGFKVIRKKIETWPKHPEIPTKANGKSMPPGCYLESHIAVTVNTDAIQVLRDIAKEKDAHLSRNAFKDLGGGKSLFMLTVRRHGKTLGRQTTIELFDLELRFVLKAIEEFGDIMQAEPPIVEFAIFDTNTHHDDAWLNAA